MLFRSGRWGLKSKVEGSPENDRGRAGIDPFDVYRALRALNPSPYMYHLILDGMELVGSSPELLVRVADVADLNRVLGHQATDRALRAVADVKDDFGDVNSYVSHRSGSGERHFERRIGASHLEPRDDRHRALGKGFALRIERGWDKEVPPPAVARNPPVPSSVSISPMRLRVR